MVKPMAPKWITKELKDLQKGLSCILQCCWHLEFLSHVFDKDVIPFQEGPTSVPTIHKEKRKGIFSNVIRDIKGNKTKQGEGTEAVESEASLEELSAIFSTSNFTLDIEKRDGSPILDEDDVELNIDDIDLEEEPREKPKGQKIITLNKKKLNSGLQALKGKLISKKVKSMSTPVKEQKEDVKNVDAVDQIKKRYGFPSSSEMSAAKTAESKLHDNLGKLQGINSRTTEMQDTALSFSAMAQKLLRTVEQGKSA